MGAAAEGGKTGPQAEGGGEGGGEEGGEGGGGAAASAGQPAWEHASIEALADADLAPYLN